MTDRGDSEGNTAATPRIALPKNIAQTLKFLDDVDLETLRLSVDSEVQRRRSLPGADPERKSDAAPPKSPRAKAIASGNEAPLPAGKVNLIKASAKSGMKPTATARKLHISLAEINRVLGVAANRKR